MQFLDTARELEVYTLRQCVKFPKRYTFFVNAEIARLANGVYNGVKAANSVFPTNAAELQTRLNYLIDANCNLQCLISQLDIAKELFGGSVDAKVWVRWMNLIEKEAKLISALRKSDKERYKFSP